MKKNKLYQQTLLVITSILTFVCMLIIPVNALSDTTAPQIKGFSISKNSISAPDKVQMTVNITDEGSGVKWVKVFYYNPSKTQQLCAHLSETSSGIWQGNLEFDRYAEEGTYTLWEIIAADVAGNQVDIYDTKLPAEYANKKITVSNVTKPTTGNQSSETTKPTTGNQSSETTKPTTDNQGDELTDPTNDNNDQSARYVGLFITLAIVITCSIVVIVLKRKNKCRWNS